MIELVDLLSDHVNAGLLAAGWPRLTSLFDGQPGRIVLGDRHQYEQLMPPRILMTPTTGDWGARSTSRGTANLATNTAKPNAEAKATMAQRTILTEGIVFDVACWGIAKDDEWNSGALDFTFTRAIYCQLLATLQATMAGNFTVKGGLWRRVPNVQRVGREYVFSLTLFLPVFAELPPSPDALAAGAEAGLPFAPADVGPEITDVFVGPSGLTGPGCEE